MKCIFFFLIWYSLDNKIREREKEKRMLASRTRNLFPSTILNGFFGDWTFFF